MEFLLIGFFFLVVWLCIPKAQNNIPNVGDKFVIQKKQCPPHQWFWQEVVDQHGDNQGWKMVCKVCGPLRGSHDEG